MKNYLIINLMILKKTWKLINSLLNKTTRDSKSNIFKIDSVLTNNKTTIVNSFNKYFSEIGPSLAQNIPSTNAGSSLCNSIDLLKDSIALIPTDCYEVESVIRNIKSSASSGVDMIPIAAIKSVSKTLAPILATLINHSFSKGIFPDALKISKITPILKTGAKSLLSNYRPISLLNSFSKVYEKIFLIKLNSFLSKHNIIYEGQYGFQKNKSTQHALISFVDTVTEALDSGKFVLSIFLDLSKAFDTVDHSILLNKLYKYGIRGVALDFITSYLSNRCQFVEIDGTISSSLNVTCGVPQGSTLGPTLFLLYINDLSLCSKLLKLLLFADDTTVSYSSSDINLLVDTVNKELELLQNWFNLNKLSLNPLKSSYMIFSNQKQDPVHQEIFIGNQSIIKLKNCKFLGVEIDSALKWKNHIRQVEIKLSSAIYIIRNIRYKINRVTALKLYDTLILSHLTYCNVLWGNAYKSYLENLYRLQKRALRLCFGEKSYRRICCLIRLTDYH